MGAEPEVSRLLTGLIIENSTRDLVAMRSCVLSMRYGDTMRPVVVVVHGPPVVIFGRREMRGWQRSVDIEESVSKQVRDDAQVEIAFTSS